MKLRLFIPVIALLSFFLTELNAAEVSDDFDAMDALLDKKFAATDVILERRFDAVEQAIGAAFSGLARKIEVDWGAAELVLPQAHQWVDYSPDMQTRRIMDFESGHLSVETLLQPGQSFKQAVQQLTQALQAAATDSMDDIEAKDQLSSAMKVEFMKAGLATTFKKLATTLSPSNTNQAVLQNVLAVDSVKTLVKSLETLSEGELVNELSVDESGLALADTNTTKKLTVKANDLHQAAIVTSQNLVVENKPSVKKISINLPFLADYQTALIEQQFVTIQNYAKKYQLPVSLVLAIIQTESSFNPRATSSVPAFGLMQLVPKTAGVDAYRHVYGKKKLLEPEYLYNPENNIELGVAYFNLLTTRYLRKINDPLSRFYCAVAAYNTGVGNVAKSFTGKKNFSQAAKLINKKSAKQVFDFLTEHLPASETRRYLHKVTQAKLKYEPWDKV